MRTPDPSVRRRHGLSSCRCCPRSSPDRWSRTRRTRRSRRVLQRGTPNTQRLALRTPSPPFPRRTRCHCSSHSGTSRRSTLHRRRRDLRSARHQRRCPRSRLPCSPLRPPSSSSHHPSPHHQPTQRHPPARFLHLCPTSRRRSPSSNTSVGIARRCNTEGRLRRPHPRHTRRPSPWMGRRTDSRNRRAQKSGRGGGLTRGRR